MLNQVILVGRLYDIYEDERKIVLKIPRSFKNELGEYENDYIKCNLPSNADMSLLRLDAIVGIKGRLQKREIDDLEIVAEKVTFI